MSTPQAPPLPPGMVAPRSIITLKRAEDGDRQVWVEEDPHAVVKAVNDATTRLVGFTRVMGMKPSSFFTRPDNIANVEPYR